MGVRALHIHEQEGQEEMRIVSDNQALKVEEEWEGREGKHVFCKLGGERERDVEVWAMKKCVLGY